MAHRLTKKNFTWVTRQMPDGWRLKLVTGDSEYTLRGMLLQSLSDVKAAVAGPLEVIKQSKQR